MPIIGIIASSGSTRQDYVGTTIASNSPYFKVWPVNPTTGYGTRVANPATLPVAGTPHIQFSRQSKDLGVTVSGSPYIIVYPFTKNGYGSKYADPATLPAGNGNQLTWSNTDLIVTHATSPFVSAYPFTNGTGFGTKYANPSTALPANGGSTKINNSDTVVGFTPQASPFLSAYAWTNGSGFGSKYADPATLPYTSGWGAWNNAGSAWANGLTTDANVSSGTTEVWRFSVGWSTKYAAAPSGVANYYGSQQPEFNSTDTALGQAQYSLTAGNKVIIYAWNNSTGWGTKYSQPSSGDVNDGRGFSWSRNNDMVSYVGNSTPWLHTWPWNNSTGFGTKYADPAELPGFISAVIAWGRL